MRFDFNILLMIVGAILLAQIVVILILVIVDLLRKRRRAPSNFPWTTLEPVDVEGNELRIYTYGEELFNSMLQAIEQAEHQILFETFIWKDDTVGVQFKRRLIDAARRGVDVHIIYDSFANLVVPLRFKRFPPPIQVVALRAFPHFWQLWDPRRYARDHRKILVVDGHIGFVGGFNIGAHYATEWRDTHIRIVGPAAADLENAFIDFWNAHRRRGLGDLVSRRARVWLPQLRLHRNDPTSFSFPIRAMYLEAINRATHDISMTHAYFIPDRSMLQALLAAAARGVDVRILLPARSNHIVADWLARGFYGRFLRGGIRLMLYQNAMIHAKTAVIDGTWSTIGTANMDRLSLVGNFEINLEVIDKNLSTLMERVFAHDLTNARGLMLDEWQARPWFAKVGETVLLPLRPLL